MAVDVETRQALLGNRSGGLSGPAIKPIALSMVWECYQEVDLPIIGVGGITTAEDALQFLLAGARAVQVGTATFREPRALAKIIAGLEEYLARGRPRGRGRTRGMVPQGEAHGWLLVTRREEVKTMARPRQDRSRTADGRRIGSGTYRRAAVP